MNDNVCDSRQEKSYYVTKQAKFFIKELEHLLTKYQIGGVIYDPDIKTVVVSFKHDSLEFMQNAVSYIHKFWQTLVYKLNYYFYLILWGGDKTSTHILERGEGC